MESVVTKYKTAELVGEILNLAVAKAEGLDSLIQASGHCVALRDGDWYAFRPATDWRDAGPIIERERIELVEHRYEDGMWGAAMPPFTGFRFDTGDYDGEGQTALIAAMRAFVASKLGETVDLE